VNDSDLVFQNPPLAQPADLVFGVPAYVPADVNVTFASGLPPLSFAATVEPYAEVFFSGTLPPLTFSASVLPLVEVTFSGSLPPLTVSASITSDSVDLTLNGTFPLTFAASVAPLAELTLSGSLPPLTVTVSIGAAVEVTLAGTLPPLTLVSEVEYNSDTARPLVGQTSHPHQIANKTELGWEHITQDNLPYNAAWQAQHQTAAILSNLTQAKHQAGLKLDNPPLTAPHTEAMKPGNWGVQAPHQESLRDRRISLQSSFQEGIDRRASTYSPFQEMLRDRRGRLQSSFQSATQVVRRYSSPHQTANAFHKAWQAFYQEAMRPPAGIETIVVPPEPPIDPCYIPSGNLVFEANASSNTNLLFFCETNPGRPPTTTIVVPIRSVYVVINDVWLRRVSGNVMLPTVSLSLSIDADSWTWGFSASLPASALDALQPTSTGPVELEANINGNLYRVLAEKIGRDRSFGNSTIRVTGRGKTALLSAPYAPVLTFANAQQRTAQQLMADVLTFNNVPLGWSVDWQLDDWLVPADAFNVRGTYIDGLTAIAGAAGAYLKPDPVAQSVSVLLRYPVAPWDWASEVTPEYSLPSSVTVQEGIEWLDKPDYNRVFVSGTSQGVLGQVTREGTAGDLPAQMVTDPLITAAAAARQRGLSILADTGKQAMVRLRLPVLNSTGVIDPGRFVQYSDGVTSRLGIVRSTNVDVSWPDVWQTLELETHL